MTEANRLISDAMAVLRDAERVAAERRADADQYHRRRAAEADLLLQKARRVLLAAESKAAVILAAARASDVGGLDHGDADADQVIDLDALAAEPVVPQPTLLRSGESTSELDRLLESAIGRAVTRAFPAEATTF